MFNPATTWSFLVLTTGTVLMVTGFALIESKTRRNVKPLMRVAVAVMLLGLTGMLVEFSVFLAR